MTTFNWTKTKQQTKQRKEYVTALHEKENNKLHKQLLAAKLLEEKGWQTCPICNGGRHPAYPTCLQCKSNGKSDAIHH